MRDVSARRTTRTRFRKSRGPYSQECPLFALCTRSLHTLAIRSVVLAPHASRDREASPTSEKEEMVHSGCRNNGRLFNRSCRSAQGLLECSMVRAAMGASLAQAQERRRTPWSTSCTNSLLCAPRPGAAMGATTGAPSAPPAAADRARQEPCQALPYCAGSDLPVEARALGSGDSPVLCAAHLPGAPDPMAAND